ncbi:hypothetical protein QFZ94_007489 [Paraburkholderia sp. JPY465]|uniref:hypothetical protein n=1 Tax=Paraburkholderia sp. JPY465 TaxID=3042285 RepID=UPI003D226AD2
MNAQQLNRQSMAMRHHLQHENDRLREALRLIVEMSENTTSAMSLGDIARIARLALVTTHVPPNPSLATGEHSGDAPARHVEDART